MTANKITLLASSAILLITWSCEKRYNIQDEVFPVQATMETAAVPTTDDTADDPCIWIHPTDPALSTIIGTNKNVGGGLHVYDLEGQEIQFTGGGQMNNVDIRYNFPLGDKKVALVTAGERSRNTLAIYTVDPATRNLDSVAARDIPLGLEEVYGSCMYHSPVDGGYYAIVNDKNGRIEQWRLFDNGAGAVDGELVRTLSVPSQPEGCVADDILAQLYVGEEEAGIWKFGAEPADPAEGQMIDKVGNHMVPDVEGLTIYYADDSTGYLIASSQGNNTYVIYTREVNNDYVGTFRIINSENIDGTSDTDGIDVTNAALGSNFPDGLFVVQDGSNPGANQNFKCVRWGTIARMFDPPLTIETAWDPR
ncbi:MAG: phytase [Fidelibacterota bacterium]|nr:MAG: phytase [Candidatus Neomarinimicrobiota bacterium]